jgi:hypothetical protein
MSDCSSDESNDSHGTKMQNYRVYGYDACGEDQTSQSAHFERITTNAYDRRWNGDVA